MGLRGLNNHQNQFATDAIRFSQFMRFGGFCEREDCMQVRLQSAAIDQFRDLVKLSAIRLHKNPCSTNAVRFGVVL